MTDADLQRRHIAVPGTHNFRDAGGYATRDGRRMRWGRLLRGEYLSTLDPAREAVLNRMRLGAVVDLRTVGEASANPSPFAGHSRVRYLHKPIFTNFRNALPATQIESYERMFEERANMRAIFADVAAHADTPILVHCTAGKDRTGVVVMLLHELCGVSRADQLRDYLHTATLMDTGFYNGLRKSAGKDGIDLHKYEEFLKCVPETFNAIITHVDDVHGGAERYLLDCGVTQREISALRDALVE